MQGGVSSRAIYNWLWIFSLFFAKKNSNKIQKKIIKKILWNVLVRTLQCFWKKINIFLPTKTWINQPQKLLIIGPQFFFQYFLPAQNQHKSHILFHKNGSLRDFFFDPKYNNNSNESSNWAIRISYFWDMFSRAK